MLAGLGLTLASARGDEWPATPTRDLAIDGEVT